MKKILMLISAAAIIITSSSCQNTSKMDSIIRTENNSVNYETITASEVNPKESTTKIQAADSVISSDKIGNTEYDKVDIDLTLLNPQMMYAQVFEIVNNPDIYNGKVIKAQGNFSYFKNEKTGHEYFAVLISDITACCAQGIEFVLDGNYSYPIDYPPLDTEITITGVCDVYYEGINTFCQLLNAGYEIA